MAAAAAAQQQATTGNIGVYQQQQQQCTTTASRASYLHTASGPSVSSVSRGAYRGGQQTHQQSQSLAPVTGGGVTYHSHGSANAMPSGSGVLRQQTKEPAYHPQVRVSYFLTYLQLL